MIRRALWTGLRWTIIEAVAISAITTNQKQRFHAVAPLSAPSQAYRRRHPALGRRTHRRQMICCLKCLE
jgi:hypothetical protein